MLTLKDANGIRRFTLGGNEMGKADGIRHIRHAGLMIDASFRKDGSIEYYVVERGTGRFHTLEAAKEIAEARSKRKAA